MGVQASLDIEFERQVGCMELIEALKDIGWTYNDNGRISYLPLGDDDMFDWQVADIDRWDSVLRVIQDKVASRELVGLCLTWRDSSIGGVFLIDHDGGHLNICISINRRKLSESRDTDFRWYVDRIVTPLENKGYKTKEYKEEQI